MLLSLCSVCSYFTKGRMEKATLLHCVHMAADVDNVLPACEVRNTVQQWSLMELQFIFGLNIFY